MQIRYSLKLIRHLWMRQEFEDEKASAFGKGGGGELGDGRWEKGRGGGDMKGRRDMVRKVTTINIIMGEVDKTSEEDKLKDK